MVGYLYGGNTGVKTQAELQREREIVDALIARGQGTPHNLGEGLSTLGQAIASRMRRKRLEGDEAAGKEAGAGLMSQLFPQESDSPTITPQSEIQTGPLNGGMSTYQPEPSLAGSPYPTSGPETPPGPADWQQGEAMPVPEPMNSPAPFPKTENTLEHMNADQLTRFMADPRFEHMPKMVQEMVAKRYEQVTKPVDPPAPYSLSPGELRFDGNNKEIAHGIPKTPETQIYNTVQAGGDVPDGELRKELQKNEAKNWGEFQNVASVSAQTAQDLTIVDELITMAPQGPVIGRLASVFPGTSSSGAALDSIVKRLAPTLRVPGSGSTSDIEYDGMLRGYPALRNKPEANKLISQIMKSKAQINVERGQIVDAYSSGEITAPEARKKLNELNKRSILTPEMRLLLAGVDPKATEGDPELEDALKQYGD